MDRDGGKVVEPGKPDESELVRRITATEPDEKMPPPKHHRQLKTTEIEVLCRWVAEGAKWRDHWSLIVPRRPPLPSVTKASWVHNGIDYFHLGTAGERGLVPCSGGRPKHAHPSGHPRLDGPSSDSTEVEAFLTDSSADAYLKVVDRLLQSPRFGEHMAVDWLDAARYADTNGFQVDRDRRCGPGETGSSTPSIEIALRPIYDRAACGRPLAEPTAQSARRYRDAPQQYDERGGGNHRGGVPRGIRGRPAGDDVDDLARATVGCARCHDHKYDPLSQKDYYRLSAFFNNTSETGMGNFGATFKRIAPVAGTADSVATKET